MVSIVARPPPPSASPRMACTAACEAIEAILLWLGDEGASEGSEGV
jgi:hypothetical protein